MSFELANGIANEYTILLKGISGYIKYLKLNDLENTEIKLKTKKPKPETK